MKVVTAQEMARLEKWAESQGVRHATWMLNAGARIAEVAEEIGSGPNVALLIGKGNKGGDAYVAGIHLLRKGYSVRAIACVDPDSCSELNRHFSIEFVNMGGALTSADVLDFAQDDLIIDGLLGTGFQGSDVEGPMAAAIRAANASNKPILAIDIPSGLNGTTGACAKDTMKATHTVTLELYKTGLFLRDGYNYVGALRLASIGMAPEIVEKAQGVALIPAFDTLKLPPMSRTQHKYERGFALGFGGSGKLKGAIKLSATAAIHTGAGIVKVFSLEEIGSVADELICQLWNPEDWRAALAKASAVFIGPGLGRSDEVYKWLKTHLPAIQAPCVLDADALFFLRDIHPWPKQCILTPHRGEMLHLLGKTDMEEEALFQQCQALVDRHQIVLILKGAPTFIFSPNKLPFIIPRGDPGMATAGSGDVLTGILAALLSQKMPLLDAAILAVYLHALSGEAAAKDKTSYGYSASDLIAYLPNALQQFSK